VCGGEVVHRPDDTEAAINRRLDLYEEQTAPLIAWFSERSLLETVDGTGTQGEIFDRLVKVVDVRLGAT
jgi:adenylate kinase